jgi:hypothetical protein
LWGAGVVFAVVFVVVGALVLVVMFVWLIAVVVTAADFAGATTNVNFLDVTAPIESTTCIVNKYDPAAVGVPIMSPVAAVNFNPLGSCPVVKLQVYGGVPPPAISRHEYTPCTPPLGSGPPS